MQQEEGEEETWIARFCWGSKCKYENLKRVVIIIMKKDVYFSGVK